MTMKEEIEHIVASIYKREGISPAESDIELWTLEIMKVIFG